MQASVGIPLNTESEDPALANFNQIIDEWTMQVRSRIGNDLLKPQCIWMGI
uniref:Uncharacterized protein n=1 Tax=Rhizophora mucronata TaxID=61149 RepID=A0A2P2KAU4_RHIMU